MSRPNRARAKARDARQQDKFEKSEGIPRQWTPQKSAEYGIVEKRVTVDEDGRELAFYPTRLRLR